MQLQGDGKKFGKSMKGGLPRWIAFVAGEERLLSSRQVAAIASTLDGQPVVVEVADVEIISEDIPGWLVSNEGSLHRGSRGELTDALRQEGMARDAHQPHTEPA
jgi:isoleucyl-tRNA synthetase